MQHNRKAAKTRNRSVKPINGAMQPINGAMQPINATMQPIDATMQPIDGAMQPIDGAMQPIDGAMQPISGAMQPISGTMQPISGTMQPINGSARVAVGPVRRQLGGYSQRLRVSQRLLAAQTAIALVQNDERLRERMAAHGYSAARMAEGHALHAQAQAHQGDKRAVKHVPLAATATRHTAQAETTAAYKRHLRLARVALRGNDTAAQALGLHAPRARTIADWLLQARQFYGAALADPTIVEALAQYGIAGTELAATQSQVATVAECVTEQQEAKLGARHVAVARRGSMAALDAWMRDFLAVADVALAPVLPL